MTNPRSPSEGTSPLIELKDVEVRFPARGKGLFSKPSWLLALRKINLAVDFGEAVGLVGESGCGKSTLGRTALLLQRPYRGKVLLDSTDLTSLDPGSLRRHRSRMQMIFQDPAASLNPRMTVDRLLSEPFSIHHLGAKRREVSHRVRTLLDQVGLPAAASKRYPHEFSGGQRQRIAIARALSPGPDFIVADEPTSALDVTIGVQILDLLKELQKAHHLSILFISHDLLVVRVFCTRIAVMYMGEIVEMGPNRDLTERPAHPYTKALLDSMPTLERRPFLASLKGEASSPVDLPSGCIFHPRCPQTNKVRSCFEKPPDLLEVAPGRWAACHLAGERLGTGSDDLPRSGNENKRSPEGGVTAEEKC